MALIECKECGHKVSDKAECCPNCGCPIEEIMSADASNDTNVSQVYDDAVQFDDIPPKKSKGWLWTIVVILVLAAIGVGVWLFTNGKLGEDDPTTAKVEITPEFIAAVHQYDELYPFSEGLAAVKKNDKFGFINTQGELVIPCQYQYAGSFKEGLACVVKDEEDNNISFIDAKGEMLHTKYPFDSYYYFAATGQTYIGPAISFTNGVCEIKYILGYGEEPQTVFIDKQIKEVAQPAEESTQSEENLGYEIFSVSDKDIYGEERSLVGVKDKDGKIVIPAKYSNLEISDNGVVLARMFIESAESRFYQDKIGYGLTVYGYIDFTGKSTFTDADMGKLEGYKEAQIPAMAQLKLEAEHEERQAQYEEEQRIQEELQQHPEIKFNEMLADNAWHAYGTWGKTPMEYIVTFRPNNKYAGKATFVRWINDGRRNEYSERGTSDSYEYIIKGNILEMEWDSYWDGLLKYQFAIEYSNGEIILVDTKFSNGKYRPISKTRELVPSKYQL